MTSFLLFEVASSLCVQVALIVAACSLIARWIGDARWCCRLWTICFVSIIAIIAAGMLLPHRRIFNSPDAESSRTMLAIVTWQSRLVVLLVAVWMVGVAGSLLRKIVLCWQLSRFIHRRCQPIEGDRLSGLMQSAAPPSREFGGTKLPLISNLNLLSSSDIQGPFCWQLHRPVIVLPESLLAEDDETLRHVLIHEIEHLRTQHPMQHFLQGVCSTVFWFHPAMWHAAQGAGLTREFLCDEVAATACGRFSAYLRTLAKVAERCGSASCTDAPRVTLAFGNRKSALIRRSNRLVELAGRSGRIKSWRPWIAITGFVLAVILIAQLWLPTNMLASTRSRYSPWPTWTAKVLHNTLDVRVRDFESFDDRSQLHEWIDADD